MIKRFDEMESGKSIAVYHGLNGLPNQERIDYLESIGYTDIHYPLINFEKEWYKDKCRSVFQRELRAIKSMDVVMGLSLGGYLAFELAGYSFKDVVLINPSIDRSKTKLDIKSFNVPIKRNFRNVEVFLGTKDALIDGDWTIEYLKDINVRSSIHWIEGMEHGTPHNYFIDIVNKSKLI